MRAEEAMTELWTGDFGNDYTKRQANTFGARQDMWSMVLPQHINSVLEVGANVGLNLEAISQLRDSDLYATEPNEAARQKLIAKDICVQVTNDPSYRLSRPDNSVDLVFTSGVLIHVNPSELGPSLREIHRVARRYIICAEYFAPSEEMIPYRGHDNALWRRDYGSLYLDQFPDLRCISCLFAWKRMTGLDNLTFWVFEKHH
jgi:pseudaminic acid biosynthesis-associated methylase